MPELDVGEWVYFEDMGAYTVSMFREFNNFNKPISYYYIRETFISNVHCIEGALAP